MLAPASAERDPAQRSLRGVVVERDARVGEEAAELAPLVQQPRMELIANWTNALTP